MSPYTNWSRAEFAASLQQRSLPFPKLCNRKSYIAILRNADSEWQFRLFDLPKEIRLHIYEAALLVDMEQSLCYSNGPPQMRKNLSKPVLLHTCRQIRLEATSAFYRINRFPLDCNDHYDFLAASTDNLRHITLKINCCRDCWQYYVDIDLNNRDVRHWSARQREIIPDRVDNDPEYCRVLDLHESIPLSRWAEEYMNDDDDDWHFGGEEVAEEADRQHAECESASGGLSCYSRGHGRIVEGLWSEWPDGAISQWAFQSLGRHARDPWSPMSKVQ
ncbi:hypothetical protein E4T38_04602 [Aureobasidium subglaciale]|nr:hypothetical protein E4T38_04602 [Aureobasidium subglaciale]KAI5223783.1 hypothetical protein E4T40_04378 [Aureobasidium subglaciale]KAI5227080.1 hypothetical protein E4T41_04497 [Aureobasidium subglaciale]KAI5262505.1 hypothetical protein E4T46_04383 [Aureobasidium subglaciale]